MGSLGWAQCWWCWRWEENMYIPDHMEAMCGWCIDRLLDGGAPPWYPNHSQRCRLFMLRVFHRQAKGTPYHLPEHLCISIAEFHAVPWWP